MARIVGAFAMSHVVFEHDKAPEKATRVFAGMREIGRRINALKPDLLIIVTSDHLNNFTLALQVPFIVGVADEYFPLGDMGIPRTPFRGNRSFADAFVRFAERNGFDLARAEEIRPDHGLVFPNLIVNPGNRVAVLPFYIGAANDVPPSPRRVWMLAECLSSFTHSERPKGERIVVLGTGGLSHWLCEAEQGRVNEQFDRLVIDKLTGGAGHELAELSAEQIQGQAGRSGLEMLHWLFAAGTVAGSTGEVVFYEPMPEWITGMGGIAFAP